MGTSTAAAPPRRLQLSRETLAVLTDEHGAWVDFDVPTKTRPRCDPAESQACPTAACSDGCSLLPTICLQR